MLPVIFFRRPIRVAFVLVLLIVLGAPSPAVSQEPPAGTTSVQKPAEVGEYRVGPGDLLSVAVTGVDGFDQTIRVSNSGKIHLPHLGIVRVTDMTSAGLESEVARLLRERALVNEPWVNVRVLEYRSQPVYVLGEVMLPGQFVIKSEMYLTDLVALGGGFNDVASRVGYLYRRKADAGTLPAGEVPTDEAIPIDFVALNEGRNPELNYRLRGGDVLYVPEQRKEYYFVVGDINSPGRFEIGAGPLMASRAVALAGGPMRTAKMSKGMLVRFGRDGKREELPMNFEAVLRGRQPDIPVRPNDIIFIPGSTVKTLGYGLLGVIPQAVTQGVTRVQD